jgi:hypothetical protein
MATTKRIKDDTIGTTDDIESIENIAVDTAESGSDSIVTKEATSNTKEATSNTEEETSNTEEVEAITWADFVSKLNDLDAAIDALPVISIAGGKIEDASESHETARGRLIGVQVSEEAPYVIWTSGKKEQL